VHPRPVGHWSRCSLALSGLVGTTGVSSSASGQGTGQGQAVGGKTAEVSRRCAMTNAIRLRAILADGQAASRTEAQHLSDLRMINAFHNDPFRFEKEVDDSEV